MGFTIITCNLFRDLNDWLKLVPIPRTLTDKSASLATEYFFVVLCLEKTDDVGVPQ